jgi:hypothetical protein
MKTGKRLSIVVICYVLSSFGIIIPIAVSFEELRRFDGSFKDMVAIAWITSWLFHVLMSFFWVINKRIGSIIPIIGTTVALFSFAIPLSDLLSDSDGSAIGILIMLFLPIVYFLPCLILAVYLVYFHLNIKDSHEKSA